jgi:uncharacterized membrane protein YkoI
MKVKTLLKLGVLAAAIAVLGVPASAQEVKLKKKQLPPAVLAAFKAAYPNATMKGFAREKENGKTYFEIESVEGSTMRDVLYNPDGTVESVEETIPASDLPAEAQETIKTSHPGAVVTKVEKITHGDVTEYEAHVKVGKKSMELKFDSSGKLVTKH